MNESPLVHQKLLRINQDAFEQGLYLVGYHALSGTLQCAISPPNQEKNGKLARLKEIEARVIEQIEVLEEHIAESVSKEEVLELSLYAGLAQSVTTQLVLFRLDSGF